MHAWWILQFYALEEGVIFHVLGQTFILINIGHAITAERGRNGTEETHTIVRT